VLHKPELQRTANALKIITKATFLSVQDTNFSKIKLNINIPDFHTYGHVTAVNNYKQKIKKN
jgi:uncharacterized protein YhjY with autotransporter beta-barrel domain